jgi:hypothetical protein
MLFKSYQKLYDNHDDLVFIYFCRKSSGFSRGASMYRGVTRFIQFSCPFFFSFKLSILLFVLRFELNSLFLFFFVFCYADTTNMVGGKLGLEELLVTKIFTLEHSVSILIPQTLLVCYQKCLKLLTKRF